jgi:hypothetical protein
MAAEKYRRYKKLTIGVLSPWLVKLCHVSSCHVPHSHPYFTAALFVSLCFRASYPQLVCPFSRVIPRTNNEPLAFARAPIDCFEYVNQLLLSADGKVDLVVVARAKVDLHVFVAPEEHDSTRIVDFVHGVEVWNLLS